jgi:transcription initiation factor TFIIIB Brf1 subunit/transcription initiation factor TFIIB
MFEICKECGGRILKGTCTGCGLMYQEIELVNMPERNYDEIKEKSTQKQLVDMKYMTTHSPNTSNKELKRAFNKEKMFNGEPNEYRVLVEIMRLCGALRLTETIQNEVVNIYKYIIKKNPNYFREKYFIYAALASYVLIACRMHDFPIQMSDIYEVSNEKEKHIRKTYMETLQLLDFNPRQNLKMYVSYGVKKMLGDKNPIEVMDFEKKVNKLAEIIEKRCNISGKQPLGYVAAIIYMYGKNTYKIKIKDVADALNISMPTISTRIREIKKFLQRVKYEKKRI